MIIVTGGAGFIGSNIIRALNSRGIDDILVVDQLENGKKIKNLCDLQIADYLESDEFLKKIENGSNFGVDTKIFHQGACSDTTEWNGKYIMSNNYHFSKSLLNYALTNNSDFIYASSASVYGLGLNGFIEETKCEHPLNAYAYSKLLFDQYVRRNLSKFESQVVGLRYFNVYGPYENHKGYMASTAFHFYKQIKENSVAKLFKSNSRTIADGNQQRDFVYVQDCVDVNLWLSDNPQISGIFNCGSGTPRSFKEMASEIIKHFDRGEIEFIDFPTHLENVYQNYTCADVSSLKKVGYHKKFTILEDGIKSYSDFLNSNNTFG